MTFREEVVNVLCEYLGVLLGIPNDNIEDWLILDGIANEFLQELDKRIVLGLDDEQDAA